MRLKELRKNKSLRQEDLANFLHLTTTGYNGYETGKREPNIETLCKLADYYNVTLDYLVGRDYKNDIGYLNDTQKSAVELIKSLNELNLAKAVAYMSGLYVSQ